MKITVDDERVFPSLGITAKAGDTVEIPEPEVTKTPKASKAATEKDGEL